MEVGDRVVILEDKNCKELINKTGVIKFIEIKASENIYLIDFIDTFDTLSHKAQIVLHNGLLFPSGFSLLPNSTGRWYSVEQLKLCNNSNKSFRLRY